MNVDQLYDESMPFNGAKLQSLEILITAMQSGDPSKMQESQQILENVKENTSLWLQADAILQNCQQTQTAFFTLMVLQSSIKVSL